MHDVSTALSAVTLEEAKAHLRVDDDAEDALIESLCLACTQMAEQELLRPIVSRDGAEGFGESPEKVPPAVKQWILLQVGHLFENREAASGMTRNPLAFIGGLLDPFRVYWHESS